ncbi:cation:proton antiporter [Bacillus sp. B-jedd]|uniref:cation:proton antiporter n=1 Tax=Bacillus sp. B-jedd TaxID=1476857 RepID=UPI0005157019|nr:cation:proton antiporter [Bacillus sp. B-jedd]CEG29607.1 Na+/H+ antiporter [Bacillus sp. B-jedd]
MHHFELVILLLAGLAIAVTAISIKVRKPYPIFLVIAGAIIGIFNLPGLEGFKKTVTEDEFFRDAVIKIFLPALLFEAAFKLRYSHLHENKKPILLLAFLGTFLTFLIVSFLTWAFLPVPLQAALVFGALMGATDPVSVLSIFKTMGAEKKLSIVIEGESLFNDAVAFVLYTIAAFHFSEFLQNGPAAGIGMGIWIFLKSLTLGILIGAGLGIAMSYITKFYENFALEILFAVFLAYSSFFFAESVHASGVISVITAGLIYGNYGAKIGMSPATRHAVNSILESLALFANALVFLMVGLEIAIIDFSGKWQLIALAIVFVLAARSIAVFASVGFLRNFPVRWAHVLNWGGLKGSLSIALALNLPASFTFRSDIILLTFCVVFFSLVVQGLSIGKVVDLFKARTVSRGLKEYEALVSRIQGYNAVLEKLPLWKSRGLVPEPLYQAHFSNYSSRLSECRNSLEQLFIEHPDLAKEQEDHLRLLALYTQHDAIEDLSKQHVISEEVSKSQINALIEEIEKLNRH